MSSDDCLYLTSFYLVGNTLHLVSPFKILMRFLPLDWAWTDWSSKYERGDLQDGGGVRRGDNLPPHKYIKNTSACGTTHTEHLLNAGRRPQTSQKARNSPTYLAVWLRGSWCYGPASGLSLWGGRAKFRTLVQQKPPGHKKYLTAKALSEISIPTLRHSSNQQPASYSTGHPMPNN